MLVVKRDIICDTIKIKKSILSWFYQNITRKKTIRVLSGPKKLLKRGNSEIKKIKKIETKNEMFIAL